MRLTWLALAVLVVGCVDDPRDPSTWVKKLGDPREGKEAISQLVKLKDPKAVDPLIAQYKKTKDLDVLKAIASFKDKKQVPTMIDSLEYSEESFDAAVTAANALGETPDPSAVDPLIRVLGKPLPIKTRANVVKLEAMKSLVKIGDKKAVDVLVKILETPADDQDFFLNQVAAQSLGKMADPKAVPALIRGLFMTGRGANIFQDTRTALLHIGEPAVDPLVQTLQRKNAKVEEDAKKYEFLPGIVEQKTSIVLGDLRSKKSVPALLELLAKKDDGAAAGAGKGVSSHQSALLALGQIGDASAGKTLLATLNDTKKNQKERASAAEALNLLGDTTALPSLLKIAQQKFINGTTIDAEAGALVASAATAYSRLADEGGSNATFPKIPEEIADMNEVFAAAADRLEVSKSCKKDLPCYVKILTGKDNVKAEKAAFMIARMGKPGLAELAKQVGHPDPAVRMTVLFGIAHSGDKSNKDCIGALEKQIETDHTKPPLKPIVDEMRAVLAEISSRA